MAVFELQGPDGKTYEVEAPDMAAAAGAFQKMAAPQPASDMPSIYSQFSDQLRGPMSKAALFGASDAQMGDIVAKNLGDKFVRREPVAGPTNRPVNRAGAGAPVYGGDYEVITYRAEDGSEKQAYLNKPGVDKEDFARGALSVLPQVAAGGVAGLATRGMGLMAQGVGQMAAGSGTSVAGDMALMPMGSEQGIEKGKAAAIGTMSLIGPALGHSVGRLAGAAHDHLAPLTGPLAGKSRAAVNRIGDAIMADPNLTPASVAAMKNKLGPEAVLGDMSTTLQDYTAALAARPQASDLVASRLMPRQNAAPARIRNDVNWNLRGNGTGQPRNIIEYMEQQAALRNKQAAPYYDAFRNTKIKVTPNLVGILDAAKAAGAYDKALRKMQIKRIDPNTPENAGTFLDLIKRELDGLASAAKAQQNRTDYADYSALAKALRDEVDGILSPGNPAASPWAMGRSISGEGLEGREAMELGSKVFTQKRDPYLVQSEVGNLSQFGRDMYLESARNDLRQQMGRAASNFGPKGDTSARRLLNSEFNRENVDIIAGPQAGRNISRRVDAENKMAETFEKAYGNSKTHRMQQASKVWGTADKETDAISRAANKGPVGKVFELLLRGGDAALGNHFTKSNLRAAMDGADILTRSGRDGDELVNALWKNIEARRGGKVTAEKYERVVKSLMQGIKAPAGNQLSEYVPF